MRTIFKKLSHHLCNFKKNGYRGHPAKGHPANPPKKVHQEKYTGLVSIRHIWCISKKEPNSPILSCERGKRIYQRNQRTAHHRGQEFKKNILTSSGKWYHQLWDHSTWNSESSPSHLPKYCKGWWTASDFRSIQSWRGTEKSRWRFSQKSLQDHVLCKATCFIGKNPHAKKILFCSRQKRKKQFWKNILKQRKKKAYLTT